MNLKYKGFTLVELSIVILIIGLLAGGILVGSDLIQAARLRAITTDIRTYETAVNTFKLKYQCLPGDCANTTTLFPNATRVNGGPLTNGNGDGFVMNVVPVMPPACSESNDSGESGMFWYSLNESGYVGVKHYVGASGPLWGVESRFASAAAWTVDHAGSINTCFNPNPLRYSQQGDYLNLMKYDDLPSAGIRYTVLKTSEARDVDEKMDDGNGSVGRIIGGGDIAGGTQACTTCPTVGFYQTGSPRNCGTYDLTSPSGCVLHYRLN